jgi:phage terminase large subunit
MIKLNEKYEPLFINETRFFILTGGRGSAKSFGVGTFASLLSFEEGHKILFTRQTMTSAHLSIIPEFQEKIDLMELQEAFDINKSEIKNKLSDSEIIFRGIKTSSGDQTANLKSLQGVTTWILDEAEELTDESTFDKINLSVRIKGKHNRVILILNPSTKEHWIYKRFFEQSGVQEGFNGIKGSATYIHTTYLDNIENLDEAYVQELELLKVNNPFKYQHVIMGGWLDRAEGVVYNNWSYGKYVETGYKYFGQDYGFSIDPTTLVECDIDKANKKIYVRGHLYKAKMTTSEIANVNKEKAGKKLIIADSAEPRLIEELENQGCNMKAISKPLIIDRIALMQDWQIIVDEESEESIIIGSEFNNYIWHDKKSKTPVDAFNHYLDPIGYVLWDVVGNPPIKVRSSSTSNYR